MKTLSALFLGTVMAAGLPAAAAADIQDWKSDAPKTFESLKAPVRIINLWATWCGPCRKEMPEMSAWYKKQKKGSVDMVGIALDNTDNIGKFLKQTPVSYPIWRYTGNNSRTWMKSVGNNVGALPFTTVEAPKCGYKQALLGEVTAKKLDEAVQNALMKCTKK
ncbi:MULTISPECIES: TlpA disulfide reductase family protein [unclassified Neisseria]|uniref:TlpA disulfide reductase family protein n=1 Tax=unclassified Neisseria TaxID=2623750 RepID=UPI002666B4BB|nr:MULTISPECIES: TlpA disulfide reductase family protein [unclassified Neisseria]MDO1509689.1 TlpA disulfide reductase family protein [Neisseria sp. MVDL19-042950]MDO1515987.1 TlpA disulfide reductase family protein [Neisseria sp. MVDL18-041461]MDO1563100.1 TlpA disulfide reductase family protein [Neisseria sp. MVDL20-010259]